MDKSGRNYYRNTILALAKINKPFIVRGRYVPHPDLDYLTYVDIRPYVPTGASTNLICDHLNVMLLDFSKYIAVRPELGYTKDYLVCRGVKYKDDSGNIRGGVVLTEELGIPPVICATYPKSKDIIESVDKSRYMDFFTFAEGRYAYYGRNQWTDGHKAPLKSEEEAAEEAKLRVKEKKRKEAARRKLDYTFEEFMALHKRANPLWIPPPGDLRAFGGRNWLKVFVPQKYLREILDRQPALRKQVHQEFLKKL